MNVQIRPAVPADAASLARVRIYAWRAAYRGLMPEAFLASLDLEKETRRVQDNLAGLSPERYIFAAEVTLSAAVGGKVVGFCAGGPDRDQDPDYPGELYAIYVLPEFQGHGIGKQLVRKAASWLSEHGYAHFLIWVLRDNHPARRFYETLGGQLARERFITLGGEQLPEVGYGYETNHFT